MLTCYPSAGKRKARKVCDAFAAGCGGRVAPPDCATLAPGAAFFYGWTAHTARLIAECEAQRRDWFYADNAYWFGRGDYFRVTRGALMHDGRGSAPGGRVARFGLAPRPWRKTGRHVVVATQSELFYRLHLGVTRAQWTERVVAELKRRTARPVAVCDKPEAKYLARGQAHSPALAPLLAEAWAVVAYSSSVLVQALLAGVPVFSLGPSMASCMGRAELARIETPAYPDDRLRWLQVLAANQWTREEMRGGTCWKALTSGEVDGRRLAPADSPTRPPR